MPHNQKTNIPILNSYAMPQLILVCLERGQKVAQMPIDNLSDAEFNAIIEYQKLLGRSWELELGES